MDNWPVLVHSGIAILGTIVLITKLKVHPVYALLLAILYLGLTGGLGPEGTLTTLTDGFGDILAKIGLLIAFGITMGTALAELGAIDRIVRALIRWFGTRRSPFALGITAGTVLQPIFADVMLVVTAPIARGLARRSGDRGVPIVASALVTGILVGLVMMIPSVGSLALAGVINVPLWKYLIFGTLIGALTIGITIFVMRLLLTRTRLWNPALDEDHEAMDALDAQSEAAESPLQTVAVGTRRAPLWLALSPLVLTLLLIAAGSIGDLLEIENELLLFLANPTFALFLGSGLSLVLVAAYSGGSGVKNSLNRSFTNLGEVLILTGLGGSLAGMVQAIGLGDILAAFFSSSFGPPLLVAWLIAVVLHIAIGSVSVAAITSAGILGPVAAASGVDPLLIALAAGAGSLFLMTVHSNFFWMTKNLLGQSTRGALKVVGFSTSIASVVGLGLVLLLSLFL
ncbi:H+/gluconate symporter-like permease [Pseudoclavibacter sp. JAI123]|uniref:GntP family permease n=1 Tax=Pseudoclavibacter sp. JAI123 TaxID=2723065 RepID=UPI0015CCB163|nr:SLC13 family permease [Pseudoclavibacter sp. JAI123]NYF11960.1 H+/gluconate symporter-like permease [Pseudoclavibacter sp. JAI123]